MTLARREELITKEILTTKEFQELTGIHYKKASTLLTDIKRWCEQHNGKPRVTTKGKIHIQDYLDYYNISRRDFYGQITMDQRAH